MQQAHKGELRATLGYDDKKELQIIFDNFKKHFFKLEIMI